MKENVGKAAARSAVGDGKGRIQRRQQQIAECRGSVLAASRMDWTSEEEIKGPKHVRSLGDEASGGQTEMDWVGSVNPPGGVGGVRLELPGRTTGGGAERRCIATVRVAMRSV